MMLLFPVGPLGLVFDLVVFVRLIIIKALLLLVHIHGPGTGAQAGAEAKYHYPNEAIAILCNSGNTADFSRLLI